ncbi:MAG: cation:proton antiporter [Thiotrichales bacterium]
METLFSTIEYRDPLWIAIAFMCGFGVSLVGLPPLVGFLVAGFVLHALGAEGGVFLSEIAELGVTLLLFSIGLKLRVKQLLRPEVWGVASVHMGAISVLLAGLFIGAATLDLPLFRDLTPMTALLLGFALSFSSTVFAVKVLEEKGDMAAWYGRLAIGVLILQDIAAVIFLGISAAKLPSPWAVVVLAALFVLRPLLLRLLQRVGHGELLVLLGLVLALGGASLFEAVDLKGDLGALVFGVLLAGHAKASELSRALLGLKDLFLVGFFLSIGMAGAPDLSALLVAGLLLVLLPIKTGVYFWVLARFRVRARTASLAAVSLANYSEFGLIVAAIAATSGWLSNDWLVVIAVAVAGSFALAAVLNNRADRVYVGLRPFLRQYEHTERLQGDEPIQYGDARILVSGMGRVGTGAYDTLVQRFGDAVVGVDFDFDVINQHQRAGRNVRDGNLTNPDFWARIDRAHWKIDWILLAMPTQQANLKAATLAREWGFTGKIGATVKYGDELDRLERQGVDAVFNIYAEAGTGFAEHAQERFVSQSVAPMVELPSGSEQR